MCCSVVLACIGVKLEMQSKFSIKVLVILIIYPWDFQANSMADQYELLHYFLFCYQVAVRVRPLLDHDRKQEVCVSASGGENGKEHEATYTKNEICVMYDLLH